MPLYMHLEWSSPSDSYLSSIAGLRGRHWGFQVFRGISPTSLQGKIVSMKPPSPAACETVHPLMPHQHWVLWACKWLSKNQSVINKFPSPLLKIQLHKGWSKLSGERLALLNSFYHVPGMRQVHSHLTQWGRYYCSHLTDEQVKVQRSWVTCPRSHN